MNDKSHYLSCQNCRECSSCGFGAKDSYKLGQMEMFRAISELLTSDEAEKRFYDTSKPRTWANAATWLSENKEKLFTK